jgi:hypothetical protein
LAVLTAGRVGKKQKTSSAVSAKKNEAAVSVEKK